MAYQAGKRPVTTAAKGDAPQRKPGPTPAPVKTYKQPPPGEKDTVTGYGGARNFGPSSVEPGVTNTSPLADELKRMNALGDGGDHLQDIIERGTARDSTVDLQSSQTRNVSADPYPVTPGMRNRSGEGAKVPAKLGQAVFDPNRKPGT